MTDGPAGKNGRGPLGVGAPGAGGVGMAVLIAGTATIALGGVLVVLVVSRDPDPTPASRWRNLPSSSPVVDRARQRPEVDSHIFQVAEATGRVEVHRGDHWILVSRGDVLTQDDVVRTGNGRALLKLGLTTEVALRERVELRLDSISRAGASLDLRRGKVVARVDGATSSIVITAARTRTANDRAAPARFIVLADDHGQVTVAATEGAARFESAGQAVIVPAGKVSQASPGSPPDNPETIPEEIFLLVTWPTRESRDDDQVPIGGRVDARSAVSVNGIPAEPDRNGRFAVNVPVRNGTNPVTVEVEDISGRVRAEKREVRKIPTRPPDLEPVKTELWETK